MCVRVGKCAPRTGGGLEGDISARSVQKKRRGVSVTAYSGLAVIAYFLATYLVSLGIKAPKVRDVHSTLTGDHSCTEIASSRLCVCAFRGVVHKIENHNTPGLYLTSKREKPTPSSRRLNFAHFSSSQVTHFSPVKSDTSPFERPILPQQAGNAATTVDTPTAGAAMTTQA